MAQLYLLYKSEQIVFCVSLRSWVRSQEGFGGEQIALAVIKSCKADQLSAIYQVSREGEGKYSTELWSEEAVNTIQDLANSSQPWFLQVGVRHSCFL